MDRGREYDTFGEGACPAKPPAGSPRWRHAWEGQRREECAQGVLEERRFLGSFRAPVDLCCWDYNVRSTVPCWGAIRGAEGALGPRHSTRTVSHVRSYA